MHDLTKLSIADMLEVGAHVRRCCTGASSMESIAERIVSFLFRDLRDHHGSHALVLVRFFLTLPVDAIPFPQRRFAQTMTDHDQTSGAARSLNVLASAGIQPEWNFPRTTRGVPSGTADRITVPLETVARLTRQFGPEMAPISQSDPHFLLDREQRPSVFHVAEARGSEHVPPHLNSHYDIRSVLGFGGTAGFHDVFAVLLFTSVPISREVAELFAPIALSTRTAMTSFHGPVFSGEDRPDAEATNDELQTRISTLEQLLDLQENVAIEQSRKLEERVQSEQDAREALHRVNERNAEYFMTIRSLNGSLEHQVKQLEAVNQELEAFSYSVSHDLRAPLRHLSGFADLLKREPLDECGPNARKYVQYISEASGHAGKLVDDLLSFARMGRAELRMSRVNMAALARLVISELEPEISQRSVVWKVGELPTISGDPSMLALVVKNLLSNALKYTATRSEAVIEFDATQNATETTFRVRDNGIGFDMQYVDKLFKVFQRLHRSEDFAGSGIGLAHVQRILRRHGGRAWAEGTLDKGATFYFSLPNEAPEVTDGRDRSNPAR